jgi:hypothetical protein
MSTSSSWIKVKARYTLLVLFVSLGNVALVDNFGYNLLSMKQLLDDEYEVHFKKSHSCVLDSRGDLVCSIVPFGGIFRVNFLRSFSSSYCLTTGPSPKLWK